MVSLTMQLLHCNHPNHHFLFSFRKTPNPNPNSFRNHFPHTLPWRPLVISGINGPPPPKCFPSDEFPVDETFMDSFGPKNKETEDEARYKNWTERGWAPWEEVLTPEADFARKSLNEGSEVALKSPEAIEAFKMLKPSYRKKKMEEMGLTEEDYYRKQFEVKNVPEPLETLWLSPLVVRHLPPRDWPPKGWEVDREELEFIREAHKLQAERVNIDDLESRSRTVEGSDEMCLDRYKMFLKQYREWVAANKDRLEEESYKEDQDYYPGRRKRGKDYVEGMYELPFYYPGQICVGEVTTVHLYQGAFVDIGGVHDGWVPIKYNDWYWIRNHVKVGMQVTIEILAKRDPYRFRFPIEMRLLDPNIDHLIFNRSEPPIFHREGDTNLDELRRDCGRFPVPRKMPGDNPAEEPLLSNHPYVEKLWQIHVAEQMIMDDLELNPEKYEGKKLSELSDEEEFDEENSIEYSEAPYKKTVIPKVTLKTSVKELDLEAALAERESRDKERREVEARGEKYNKGTKMRRNNEMDEYDLIHWQRSHEERQALIRDIACRRALGLPLEEPGRYEEDSYFGKDQYDPDSPLYRYDYWGEPKNSEKSKQERMTEAHNKSIVGKGTVWYETSYEDCIKQREEREAKGIKPRTGEDDDLEVNLDTDDDEDDFDYTFGFLKENNAAEEEETPRVNGTESSRISDEGMFEA